MSRAQPDEQLYNGAGVCVERREESVGFRKGPGGQFSLPPLGRSCDRTGGIGALAEGEVLAAVVMDIQMHSVLGWYRRHVGARGLASGKSNAVTVVQRVSSDL